MPNHRLTVSKTLGLLSLLGLMLLSACFNDTPYSSAYAHIVIDVRGPGRVTMATQVDGRLECTPSTGCGYTRQIQEAEIIAIHAIPDTGHTFVKWSRQLRTKWNEDLSNATNPVHLPADGDYYFIAHFR